jgi:hypothetical protein
MQSLLRNAATSPDAWSEAERDPGSRSRCICSGFRMPLRGSGKVALICFVIAAFSNGTNAETCFNACFRPQLVGADIEDSRIRSIMRRCHDMCEEDAGRRFSLSGRGEKLLNCLPAPLSQDEFRRVRSASPSFLAFANTFTWDVHNVLPDKVIKRVEAITQNLELEDVVLGGGVMIAPGETETVFIPAFFDGYPQMRVSTRIKAIYACPLE